MDDFDALRDSFRPLLKPVIAIVAMLVMSGIAFSQAGQVEIPPAPETLVLERVRLDEVRHTREPMGDRGPQQSTPVAVRIAASDDWPGITFRFSGAASSISIVPPVTFELYLASSLAEQAERHRQWPNVYPQMIVHGVVQNGQILVDPDVVYASRVARKRQSELLGYGLLALTLVPAFILFRRGRGVFESLT